MSKTFDRQLERLLRDAGRQSVREGRGSHAVWYSPITDRHVTFLAEPCRPVPPIVC